MDIAALLSSPEATYTLIAGLVLLVYLKLSSAPKLAKAPAKPWAHFDEFGCLWNRANPEGKPATRMKSFPKADNTYAIMTAAIKKSPSTLTAGKRQLKKRHWVEHQGREVEKLEVRGRRSSMVAIIMQPHPGAFLSWLSLS
jgi:hypothetical protein